MILTRVRGWAEQVRETSRPVPRHRWGLGAFLLVFAVLVLASVLVAILFPARPGEPLPTSTLLLGTIAPMVVAAGVAVGISYLRGNGPAVDFACRWTGADLRTGARLGVAGVALTVCAVLVWQRIVGPQNATSTMDVLVGQSNLSVPAAIVMFLYTWLLGPVCEEIVFRGMCWGAVARWGPFTAFGLSTAIFAVSHLEPARTVLLLVISVPIGLARLVTGSIGASVVAHQVNNFLPAVLVLLVSMGVAIP